MHLEFETTNFITVHDEEANLVLRCNVRYTDLRDYESLECYVARHGGPVSCTEVLIKCYNEAVNVENLDRCTKLEERIQALEAKNDAVEAELEGMLKMGLLLLDLLSAKASVRKTSDLD